MWKRLRRWHFDVAILVGLACFAWAYWYIKPRPAWTSYYHQADQKDRYNFTILGYSADDQSIFTAYEMWPFPRIQRWNVKSGEMLQDFPLEPTEEEQFILKQPRKHFGYSGYTLTQCFDYRHFLLRYDLATQKDYHYLRVFGVDGKAVSHGLELPRYHRGDLLNDDSAQQRHWLACNRWEPKQSEMSLTVFDLDTGKPVREPVVLTRSKLHGFPDIAAGRLFTFVRKATEPDLPQLEIVDLLTGVSKGSIPLKQGDNHQLFPLNDRHFAVGSMIGDPREFRSVVHFYKYDPRARLFVEDTVHPLNGLVSENGLVHYVHSSFLVSFKSGHTQSSSKLAEIIMGWLGRIGIGRSSEGMTLKLARLADGAPVMQCTGIPHGVYRTSQHFDSVAMVTDNTPPGLCLYRIPHYLWEATLSWIMLLSWVLIVPWPLRYWVRV